jgi:hypothetical protein
MKDRNLKIVFDGCTACLRSGLGFLGRVWMVGADATLGLSPSYWRGAICLVSQPTRGMLFDEGLF